MLPGRKTPTTNQSHAILLYHKSIASNVGLGIGIGIANSIFGLALITFWKRAYGYIFRAWAYIRSEK